MIQNPKSYWQNISNQPDWKSYILPRENDVDFDAEGLMEAQRLFYFFDKDSIVVLIMVVGLAGYFNMLRNGLVLPLALIFAMGSLRGQKKRSRGIM